MLIKRVSLTEDKPATKINLAALVLTFKRGFMTKDDILTAIAELDTEDLKTLRDRIGA